MPQERKKERKTERKNRTPPKNCSPPVVGLPIKFSPGRSTHAFEPSIRIGKQQQQVVRLNMSRITTSLVVVSSLLFLGAQATQQLVNCSSRLSSTHQRQHVMCQTRDHHQCQLLLLSPRTGISQIERERIVQAHNAHRERIAAGKMKPLPNAANIQRLVWDEELASVAQKQAELCDDDDSCSQCRLVERFSVGQLTFKVPNSVQQKKLNWDEVVHFWFEQMRHISKGQIHHYEPKEVNHSYAQVAWAETNRIGCGFSVYRKQAKKHETRLYICNYGPAGLQPGKSVYKIGAPCTQCQENTQCPPYHNSLCMDDYSSHRTRREIFGSFANISEALPTWLTGGDVQYPELMSCNFNSDCPTKSMGTDSWILKNDQQRGPYYEVSLKRGGNAVLFLLNGIPPSPSGSACLTFKYRKSTNAQRLVALKIFSWSLMGPPIETFVTHDSPSWTDWKVQIPDLKGYAIVIFHVSLPNSGLYESVTVSVDDVKIVAGDCI